MFTTKTARSGELTLLINGKAVHSLYNPKTEADTFLKKQNFRNIPQIFILIGPGLGYLKESVNRLYPNAQILSFHLDKWIFEQTIKIGSNWFYNNKIELESILSLNIPDFLLTVTSIIKWLPCTQEFPHRTKYIENRIQQFFLERKGSIFATGYFGRKWIRNAYYNFLKKNKLFKINSIDRPILIAASGPGLTETLNFLNKYRSKFILAALPSSLTALNNAKLKPDLIFHTDPGFWANEHLKHITNSEIPIVMPLTSSFKSDMKNPVIYINQDSFLENLLLEDTFIHVPSHGTVAGTAYLFLRKISNQPIVFLGLDLCFKDILEHVKPHSFDIIFEVFQNRFNGYLNILYHKKNNFAAIALSTYSGWFNSRSRLSNAYRYKATNVSTDGLASINTKQLIELININYPGDKSKLLIKEHNINLNDDTLRKSLKHIILLLENFKIKMPAITSKEILDFFINQNDLTELFQYTAYAEILKLTHFYRNDLDKSRELLIKIHSETHNFIVNLLKRLNYEQ